MPRQRVHNEWFQSVQKQAYGKGSRCPCGKSRADRMKDGLDPQMFSCGEYVNAKWRCWDYCCENCFSSRIIPRLISHANDCSCVFEFHARSGHGLLPKWLKVPSACAN